MRTLFSLLAGAALLLAPAATLAQPAAQPAATPAAAPVRSGSLPAELDAYIEQARRDGNVPGIAVAVVHGDTVVTRGYGVRRLGGTERVDENTIFNVASLTKSFTSAGAALLVSEGRMRWDDRVRDWLPEFELKDPWVANAVTMRDLLSHRAGLATEPALWAFTHSSRADVIRRLRYLEPRAPFRSGLVYSNVLYAVAGEMTAKAAGMPWERLIADRLLQPLGMSRSSIANLDPAGGNISSAHSTVDERLTPISWFWDLNTAPAGGLSSTAVDMARWMRFQLADGELDGRRLMSAVALRETHEPQIVVPTTPSFRTARAVEHFAGYGMGWQVMDYRGHAAIWHSGSAAGMPVYMTLFPKERLGILVMVNSDAPRNLHGALASRIADTYLGLSVSDSAAANRAAHQEGLQAARRLLAETAAARVPNTRPTLPPAAHAGTYASDLHGDLIVRTSPAGLTVQFGETGEIADLSHWHYNTWRLHWRNPFLRSGYYIAWMSFSVGDGTVDELRGQIGRDVIEAARRPAQS